MSNAPALPARDVQDFADWFSPMLVKELRQGLRTRVFLAVFLIAQLIMIFLALVHAQELATDPSRFNIDTLNGWFWTILSIATLVVMPLRALGSMGTEARGRMLELVHLTRLSAWRVIVGKWASLVLQSLLLAISVLPYAVLRYFFGEVDLVGDLRTFALLLLTSMAMTALVLALSTAPLWLRVLVLVLVGPFSLYAGVAFVVMSRFGVGPSGGLPAGWLLGLAGAYSGLYTLLGLRIAAARIAPLADNHSTPKRVIGIALLAMPFLACFAANDEVLISACVASAPGFLFILLDALTELFPTFDSLAAPFRRARFPGRVAAIFLHPGWATGTLYTAVCIGIPLLVPFAHALRTGAPAPSQADFIMASAVCVATAGALLGAALLVRVFHSRTRAPLLVATIYLLISGVIFSFGRGLSSVSHDSLIPMFATTPVPLAAALNVVTASSSSRAQMASASLISGSAWCLLSLVILVVRARPGLAALLALLSKDPAKEVQPGLHG